MFAKKATASLHAGTDAPEGAVASVLIKALRGQGRYLGQESDGF